MPQPFGDKVEILCDTYGRAIEPKKNRVALGTTYDSDAMNPIDGLESWEQDALGVVNIWLGSQPSARQLRRELERQGVATPPPGRPSQ